MPAKPKLISLLLIFLLLACALLPLSPALSLILGILLAFFGVNTTGTPWPKRSSDILKLSIIALGAGLNLPEILRAGTAGLAITLVSITAILVLGELMGRFLKVNRSTRTLIAVGTSICGGSAIAAIAAVLNPKQHEIAASLGIVFLLNALALVIFPPIGHLFQLSQQAFGWWAALAIHDTSSVVGAGMAYGPEALHLATIIKLSRALWIIPLALLYAFFYKSSDSQHSKTRINFPWFILGFIALAALRSFFPSLETTGDHIATVGKHALSSALFLIGTSLNPRVIVKIGWRPALLALALWLPTATLTLLFCLFSF